MTNPNPRQEPKPPTTREGAKGAAAEAEADSEAFELPFPVMEGRELRTPTPELPSR